MIELSDKNKSALSKHKYLYFIITGNDLLLYNEAMQRVRKFSKDHGVQDKVEFTYSKDKKNKLDSFTSEIQQVGFFSSKKLFYFDISSLDADISKWIANTVKHNKEHIMVFYVNTWRKSYESMDWFTTLKNIGSFISTCNTPTIQFYPSWIQSRLNNQKFTYTPEVPTYLAQMFENNTFELQQLLDQFTLRGINSININIIEESTEISSSFTPYQLSEYMMLGELSKSLIIFDSIANRLKSAFLPIIFATFRRDLITLYKLRDMFSSNDSRLFLTHQLCDTSNYNFKNKLSEHKIWGDRKQKCYVAACNRFNRRKIYDLFNLLYDIDVASKSINSEDKTIDLLKEYCTRFCLDSYVSNQWSIKEELI